ncbi:hypothetical protein M0R45_010145 [Rubus argutus]|uniref:Uncharacterized protein n=1 Tax=Rubus argutus TaxID=59490 RepID=A0AAW1Y6K1_RUBAR
MASRPPMIRRRFLCTSAKVGKKWAVKEVTKSNFADSVEEFKDHLAGSDFVAVSLQKTGSFSAAWHRALPFDTAETAYCKAKYAAERFQLLQFAACPFTRRASKLTAHPLICFILFPRDELKLGMPSYSFSVQTSHLTSMAQEGFDFNACIYNGISYLSKAQESAAKYLLRELNHESSIGKNACKKSGSRKDDALLSSLRKLRTSSTACTGDAKRVQDKDLFERELQNMRTNKPREFVDSVR